MKKDEQLVKLAANEKAIREAKKELKIK